MQSEDTTLEWLFSGCKNLKEIYGLDDALETTGVVNSIQHMFFNCKKIKKVNIMANIKIKSDSIDGFCTNCYDLESIQMPNFVIDDTNENNKTITGHLAFYSCSNLKDINMANMVKQEFKFYGQGFYWNCENLEENKRPFKVEE